LFQPLLYQVAAAALSPGDITWPVRSVFARQKNARVMMMDAMLSTRLKPMARAKS